MKSGWDYMQGIPMRGFRAVSYTHLDVYKRQVLYNTEKYKVLIRDSSFVNCSLFVKVSGKI